MHSYLRAIGFSEVNIRVDLDKIIGMVMDQPTDRYSYKIDDSNEFTEISKDFSERMGITLRGEYDEKGFFHLEHYFPHFRGQTISTREDVFFNKRVDTDAYTGMCDDIRLGVSIIFYLQNVIDYLEFCKGKDLYSLYVPVMLSGLSLDGKILLPLDSNDEQIKNQIIEKNNRNNLISEAKKGNQEAIDSLTIEDIDLFTNVSKRIKKEDLYSVVESTFIPYGSESDNYTIVGTIKEYNLVVNSFTNEEIYDMVLECNDIIYNVCINKQDLMGEPLVGRRFKGTVWLQGLVNFSE